MRFFGVCYNTCMKQFIEQIQRSIYDPDLYRELLSAPLSRPLKYFAKFTVLFAVVLTILTSIPIVPAVPSLLRDGARGVVEYFPADLEIRIHGGIVETNVVEPYLLPYPPALRRNVTELPTTHLFVIDTKTPFSIEALASSSALVWIGRDFIAFSDEREKTTFQKIDPELHVVLNRTTVSQLVEEASAYFVYIPPLLVLLFFIGFLLLGYVQLVYLLFAAFLVWLLLRLLGVQTSYGGAYRVGIHALTLPLALYGILILFGLQQAEIPFMFTLALLVIVYANFHARQQPPQLSNTKSTQTPTA